MPLPKLTHETIEKGLATSFIGTRLYLHEELGSTNTAAMELVKGGAEEGTVVVAETQTEGRGRMGRAWHSPKGLNLYFSLVLRPSKPIRDVVWLGLAAAVAVAKTIEQHADLPARVKWPNDVLVNGRKVAGLLLEQGVQGEKTEFLILGIGINLNMREEDFPAELRATATSLRIQGGKIFDRVRFFQELLAALETWYVIFLQSSYQEIRKNYLGLLDLLRQPVKIQLGEKCLEGTVSGLALDGALLLSQFDGKEISIHTGEVTPLRASRYASGH